MSEWRVADASVVRARMATAYLGAPEIPVTIGDITLRPHQRDAAARLSIALERFGGALLADDVGLGKTYTALAASAAFGRLLIVAPASLATMWRAALDSAGREAAFISFESLSRKPPSASGSNCLPPTRDAGYDVIIVDEAHHARNPATKRYVRLAAMTVGARVMLLSATPVHNATADLEALLALFVGTRGARMSSHDLAACIVRRTRADVPVATTPARAPPVWLATPVDVDVLDAILHIPPPCPAIDGTDASALVTLGLVRAWSSTDAALRGALRRRLARADSLRDALLAGRYPTRAELVAWIVGDDSTQLAFPELVASATGVAPELLETVTAHADGVSSALRVLARSDGAADAARRDHIRDVRARHRGMAAVVFSQYAASVHAMYRRLVGDGGACAITAAGAVVAGGLLSRSEALARFAPSATDGRASPRAELIELLIATDLLSEGLNLQDAAVVVHLDLPWTPARLTQRMGRVWRIGSRHASVFEYVISPPAPGERASAMIERLRRKAAASRLAVGGEVTPVDTPLVGERVDAAGVAEELRAGLAAWLRTASGSLASRGNPRDATPNGASHTLVAAIDSVVDGWLALISDKGALSLVGRCDGGGPTREPLTIRELVNAANGPSASAPIDLIEEVQRELAEHLKFVIAARDAGLDERGSHGHELVVARISAIVAAAPAHRRTIVARLASAARAAVGDVRGVGGEHLLSTLAAACSPSGSHEAAEAWLSRVAELAYRSDSPHAFSRSTQPHVVAVLVLRRRA